jgi:hypothetical protein
MKEYTPVASSYGISEENRLMWDQKEGLAFATASFNFSSKSNGTAKASVNGNGIANNFNNYTELKYETNTTAMANIGYKINSNNKVSFNSFI